MTCGEIKDLSEFHYNRSMRDKHVNRCKPCAAVARKANRAKSGHLHDLRRAQWALENPEKIAVYKRRRSIVKHGITEARYYKMLHEQGGTCAVCKIQSGKRMTIDHDHACCPGKYSCGRCIRGIICQTCNTGLGHFGDNVEVLKMAIRYLSDMGFMGE